MKNRLRRQWQITRDPTLTANFNRLQKSVTRRLNEWRNDQSNSTLESFDPEDQSLWRMTKRLMRFPTPSHPLFIPGGIALSDYEKAETLVENLESHFQPVTNPSVPAVIETVDVALRSYFLSPASEPHLTTHDEVQEAIRVLKVTRPLARTVYRTCH